MGRNNNRKLIRRFMTWEFERILTPKRALKESVLDMERKGMVLTDFKLFGELVKYGRPGVKVVRDSGEEQIKTIRDMKEFRR